MISSDHTRPITQEKFVSSLTITQPMLVLHLGTILSLFFKIKQPSHNSITHKSFVQNLSNLLLIDTQVICKKTHAYTSLKTHKNSELHLILPLLHILARNPKIKNYLCVSWPFASKSIQKSNISHPRPCYTTVTPSSPISKFKNRALQLDFSRPLQPPSAQASHCISFLEVQGS